MRSLSFIVSVGLLAALLLAAVATDLRVRRIPNKLVLTGLVIAACVHAAALLRDEAPLAGPAWWAPAAGALTGFALLMPLYLLRATGAGDVKLMAMVGGFVGAGTVVSVVLYTMLCGGLLAMLFMVGRGVATQTLANVRFMLTDLAQRAMTRGGAALAPLETTAARLPYAVAIALGTGVALRWPLAWLTAGGMAA